ncbi:MAG: MMPL family transporter [Deltaproteobacteria bacterium]|jgi:uncharacterized protein|nr:MMPL family transporter [Deltaproteobacteria bacterium]MBT6434385.1 MMPL family transporter [Deltaproteobacteria bacterium]MBT6488197.1 MMPL family transporter [Deltaproteobacteria bacterium]
MWERRLVQHIFKQKALVVFLLGLITASAGYFALQLQYDQSIEVWFLKDDQSILNYRSFLERFEAEQVVIMAVFSDDVFSKESLEKIDAMTRAAENAPNVHRVISVTNVEVPQGSGIDVFVGPLVDKLPQSAQEAGELRARILADPMLVENFTNPKGTATSIIVELQDAKSDFIGKIEMAEALRAIMDEHKTPQIDMALAGAPIIDEQFYKLNFRDSTLFGPLVTLMVILMTYAVFRRLSAVVVPLTVVVLSMLWTFGLMAALDLRFTLVTGVLIPIILAIGIADSVHVLSEFYHALRRGLEREEAALQSTAELLVPCFFTTATTMAGMLALSTAELQPIREFGFMAAFGVASAFVLSITLGPILLMFVRPPDAKFHLQQEEDFIARFLNWLSAESINRSIIVLAGSVVLVLASIYAISQMSIGTNSLLYFKEDSAIRKDTSHIDAMLGGTATFEILVETEPGGLKEPENLKHLESVESWLESNTDINHVVSPMDSIKALHHVLKDKPQGGPQLPDTRAMTAQLFLLMEGAENFESTVQDDYSVSRMTGRVKLTNSEELAKSVPELEKQLKTKFVNEDVKISLTGFIKLMSSMEQYLLKSQLKSFLVAFIIITLMLWALLRSFKLALFSMIPNFTPICVGLGVMSALNIPLDPGTVMIGGLALGLVVDDTVHFLVRFRRKLYSDHSMATAVAETITEVGRPITVTSIILSISFLILLLGSFTPNIHFGGVTSIVVLLALVADLLVLPSAMYLIKPKF